MTGKAPLGTPLGTPPGSVSSPALRKGLSIFRVLS